MSAFWEDYSDLEGYFVKVTEKLGWEYAPLGMKAWWATVERAYSREDRFYHNLDHIREMLEWFDNHPDIAGMDAPLYNIIRYSIIMHDFYCGGRDAEKRSAQHAIQILFLSSKNLSMSDVRYQMNHIWEMIEATAYHLDDVKRYGSLMRNVHVKWILDADLIRFLDPDWRKHADNIRKEYAAHPDDKFNAGRRHVLENFLKLEPFYFTLSDEDDARAKELVRDQIQDLG